MTMVEEIAYLMYGAAIEKRMCFTVDSQHWQAYDREAEYWLRKAGLDKPSIENNLISKGD